MNYKIACMPMHTVLAAITALQPQPRSMPQPQSMADQLETLIIKGLARTMVLAALAKTITSTSADIYHI